MPTMIASRKISSSERALCSRRLLVVIDGPSTSERAVNYVANVIRGRRGFRIILAALLPAMPGSLLEFGGAEDPDTDDKLEQELKREQHRFIERAKQVSRRALARMRSKLREARVVSNSILIHFSDPLRQRNAAEEILEMARQNKCRTIVIGHRAHSWFRELFQSDVPEQVVRRGEGFSFWIVE